MAEFRLISNGEEFIPDYNELVRAFAPHATLGDGGYTVDINVQLADDNSAGIRLKCYRLNGISEYCYENDINLEQFGGYLDAKSRIKRECKVALYKCLAAVTGVSLPYGSLTGIRPTKLYHDLLHAGIDADAYLKDYLLVSPSKTDLIAGIAERQRGIYDTSGMAADLFINIPFCVTRCSYCSFICAEIGKVRKFIPRYIELLVGEIERARALASDLGYRLRSAYVGGGTPTSLCDSDFAAVLNAIGGGFPEFTVEAGRPDTISESKLKIMDDMGVTRISINPQSFNDKTLETIGRSHSVSDVYKAYEAASRYGFDINTDLIAMLPGESLDDFKRSVDCAAALRPANITVHTLALKKGSALKESGYDNRGDALPSAMIDYSYSALTDKGYGAYYMYRQKYMSGNLENTGYCLEGKQCVYNIDIMEECATIFACGAGAISKAVIPAESRIERLANPKGLDVYLQRGESIADKKDVFFTELLGKRGDL